MSDTAERKLSWTQPQCEQCWVENNTMLGDDGELYVKMPARLHDVTEFEVCAWCGLWTIVGIYVRADPETVPYPAREDDDG